MDKLITTVNGVEREDLNTVDAVNAYIDFLSGDRDCEVEYIDLAELGTLCEIEVR